MVAGLSLGEYSALVASGALDFEEAVVLVAKRGVYMEEAAPAGSGKMVAVLNTPVEVTEEACQKASELGVVTPANYNTPAQIVIGGEVAAVDRAVELLQEAGAKRLIPLKVSGPFHTALLEPASQKLAETLAQVSFFRFHLSLSRQYRSCSYEKRRHCSTLDASGQKSQFVSMKVLRLCKKQA